MISDLISQTRGRLCLDPDRRHWPVRAVGPSCLDKAASNCHPDAYGTLETSGIALGGNNCQAQRDHSGLSSGAVLPLFPYDADEAYRELGALDPPSTGSARLSSATRAPSSAAQAALWLDLDPADCRRLRGRLFRELRQWCAREGERAAAFASCDFVPAYYRAPCAHEPKSGDWQRRRRRQWIDALEHFTRGDRALRSEALLEVSRRRAGREILASADRSLAGVTAPARLARNHVGRWHKQRARAEKERFQRVRECGTTLGLVTACMSCGDKSVRPIGCGNRYFCPQCRKARLIKYRDQVRRVRRGLLQEAEKAGLLRRNRRGGRWSEKHVTLTGPHLPDDTVAERVERMRKAWRWFGQRVWKELSELLMFRREPKSDARSLKAWSHYIRVLEWTPGDDGRGHPHFHLWWFGPYLPQAWIKSLWTRALCAVDVRVARAFPEWSRPGSEEGAVVHVTKCHDGIEIELIKYLLLDIDKFDPEAEELDDTKPKKKKPQLDVARGRKLGQFVDPWLFAQAVSALRAGRCWQTSAGLARYAVQILRACSVCSCVDCWDYKIAPFPPPIDRSQPEARGPPAEQLDEWFADGEAARQLRAQCEEYHDHVENPNPDHYQGPSRRAARRMKWAAEMREQFRDMIDAMTERAALQAYDAETIERACDLQRARAAHDVDALLEVLDIEVPPTRHPESDAQAKARRARYGAFRALADVFAEARNDDMA